MISKIFRVFNKTITRPYSPRRLVVFYIVLIAQFLSFKSFGHQSFEPKDTIPFINKAVSDTKTLQDVGLQKTSSLLSLSAFELKLGIRSLFNNLGTRILIGASLAGALSGAIYLEDNLLSTRKLARGLSSLGILPLTVPIAQQSISLKRRLKNEKWHWPMLFYLVGSTVPLAANLAFQGFITSDYFENVPIPIELKTCLERQNPTFCKLEPS